MKYKYLFGPIPSRRLGISLGVDLVPHKTCTLDCPYCECGKTTNLTLERKEYVPFALLKRELKDYLSTEPKLDYITFSGSGEPTLNSRIKDIISFIKTDYPQYKLALITNATLFDNDQVINDVLGVDLMIPSVDAISEEVFKKINMPHKDLSIDSILSGIENLARKFKGEIWLEIFIISRFNGDKYEISLLSEYLKKINPTKVQLNSLDRPGTAKGIIKATREELETIKKLLAFPRIEIAAKNNIESIDNLNNKPSDILLSTVKRRPCTADDLVQLLKLSETEVRQIINDLLSLGQIEASRTDCGIFYKLK